MTDEYRSYLYKQIASADPSKATSAVQNSDLEETYYQMLNTGLISSPNTRVFSNLSGKLKTERNDINIVIISDSTAAMAGSWVDLLPNLINNRFPRWSVSYRKWTDGAPGSYSAATVTAGSGSRTVNIWNGSIAGKTWTYALQDSRIGPILGDIADIDTIIFAHGHNEAQSATYQLRDKAVVSIETARLRSPGASVVLLSQNPLGNYPGMSEYRADIYRKIASERGYGFIDICQTFYNNGYPSNPIVGADNTHPTAAGHAIWANEIMRHLSGSDTYLQSIPVALPSLALTRQNLLLNGNFEDFTAPPALPSWSISNVTLAKDTTNLESKTAYSVSAAKTAGGSVGFFYQRPNYRLVAGREVTFAVRMFIPSGAAGTVGQLSITDGYTAPNLSSSIYGDYRDQWFWNIMTARIDRRATSIDCRIYVDPTTGSTLPAISIDRAVLVLGRYPMDCY